MILLFVVLDFYCDLSFGDIFQPAIFGCFVFRLYSFAGRGKEWLHSADN